MSEREKVAEELHCIWSSWMEHMFEQSSGAWTVGCVCIPAELVARWTRQMAMPYAMLTEDEKESDRRVADRLLMTRGETRGETT